MRTTGSRGWPWRLWVPWLAALVVAVATGPACEAPRSTASPAGLDTQGLRVVTIQLAGIG